MSRTESASTLPAFVEDLADQERYNIEREPRPHTDGHRLRVQDRSGAPAKVEVLMHIQAANAAGWRLDKHSDAGDELVFVPFEEGESR
jgi:hypothetical protein